MSQSNIVPVAVVGCGRMGRLHARVYSQMPTVRLAGVYDINPASAAAAAADYGTRALSGLQEVAEHARAVTVAVPTEHHLAVARPLLERGVACLIEKPLAKGVSEARQIVELSSRHGSLVQVGHTERFNPAVRAMERLDIRPRYLEVTRISPLTFRSIDVGVVLDMMIHDIDIVLKLAQSGVKKVDAVGVSVIGGVEDVCNARVEFDNGCVASLTASRMALKTERKLRVFSADAYVSLDYQKRYALVARRSANLDTLRAVVEKIRRGEIQDLSQLRYDQLVKVEELQIDDVEPLRAELDAFINAVVAGVPPVVSALDGLAAVELAQRIVESMAPGMVL